MVVSLIVPVLNEQKLIEPFIRSVELSLHNIITEIVFVDDGSTDETSATIESLQFTNGSVKLLRFSRNFGKEAALMAGIRASTGDVVVPVDVDLQDPLNLIPRMLEELSKGFDVVQARSKVRNPGSKLLDIQSQLWHKFFGLLTGTNSGMYVGDFRAMSRKVADKIGELPETNLYMKGLMSWVGFRTSTIEYERGSRKIGETKFSLSKRFSLGFDGLLAFSVAPLRIFLTMGILSALVAFLAALWIVWDTLSTGGSPPGFPTLIVSVLLLGGLNLIGISLLGEYLSRVLLEAKRRPSYVLDDFSRERPDIPSANSNKSS
jgi:polyisoprenyl-phosphate glycosyltransferase